MNVYLRAACNQWFFYRFIQCVSNLGDLDCQNGGTEGEIPHQAVDQITALTSSFNVCAQHTALVCAVSYLIGLAMVTQAGEYVVELFDQFAATLPLLLVAFFECFVVVYVYGLNRY